ncbi:MAG: hypothetical protein JXR94_19380 [Candidatus Hydrogenedentes bacterium]|nr:hypothetical protein [Candidatus Hydrogenedentota bacterium]
MDEDGTIHEAWGTIALRLRKPDGAGPCEQRIEETPVPTAITRVAAGGVSLEQTAYRAPIWPGGIDVLTARLENAGGAPADVLLDVLLPESASIGEWMVTAGGHPAVALPAGADPKREERAWGCTGGVVSLPGWGKPEGVCDPGFSNIRAGMGGVPIVYRFAVPPGATRTVVLGFCESHWDTPGQRPVAIRVEGAPGAEVDPLAQWGRHQPGCMRFDAADSNRDGRLELAIDPHPEAADKNTILNCVWVFAPETSVVPAEVVTGRMTSAAEYYVDVGGEKDQGLYVGGTVPYPLHLEPGAVRELTFLLASPGGGPVPHPGTTTWTPASLRKAAEDVWRGSANGSR